MSRIKNMSRGGWIVVGILLAMMLVPSGIAVAKAFTYTGIEGTNGTTSTLNPAHVSSAGQLLTTPAVPSAYEEYFTSVASADTDNGGVQCETAEVIPAGEAFVAQQVEVDVTSADSPSSFPGPPSGYDSNAAFYVFADSGQGCGGGDTITSGEAPANTVGNVAIPLVPGYVIPSGYKLDVLGVGIGAVVYVTGYLVPSADAPATPQIGSNGTNELLPHHTP